MRRLQITQNIIIISLLLFTQITFAKNDCETINKIESAINKGKPVAIIIATPDIKEDIRFSDAYGDWVHYWNEFITETDSQYLHIKLTPAQLPLIFRNYQPFEKSISYVFMSKNSAFYYAGAIYEPQIFSYIQYRFTDKPIPKDIAPFKPKEIKIHLLQCK